MLSEEEEEESSEEESAEEKSAEEEEDEQQQQEDISLAQCSPPTLLKKRKVADPSLKDLKAKKTKISSELQVPEQDSFLTTHQGKSYASCKGKISFPIHMVSCAHDVFVCVHCDGVLSPAGIPNHFKGYKTGGGCAQGAGAQAILAPAFKAVRT
jgi:hypothetical protein